MRKTTKLREMIASSKTILVPGVYDGLSGRIAQAAGASLLYATGGGIARSTGIPDMGLSNMIPTVTPEISISQPGNRDFRV